MNGLVAVDETRLPALLQAASERVGTTFLEFFIAQNGQPLIDADDAAL
jgi:hypothetical protein